MSKNNITSVAYLPATTVFAALNRMVEELSAVGVSPEHTTMGGSFDAWSAGLQKGQTAWIYTLEQFHSITELMGYYEAMQQRGVEIRSVKEGWFNDPTVSGVEVLGHLFRLAEQMHPRSRPLPVVVARQGERISGPLVSKVEQAVALRATRQLSVVAACRLAGCGVNAYYRYLKEQEQVQ